MILILISTSIIVAAASLGSIVFSKKRFNSKIDDISDVQEDIIDTTQINVEITRLGDLQKNLKEIKSNVRALEIPTPESVSKYDDMQSSLDKLNRFFDKHNLSCVGTEQFILSVLPTSHIGECLQSMSAVLDENVAHQLFGNSLAALKDGMHPESTADFLHKFVDGFPNASHAFGKALAHHDYAGALMKLGQHGMMNATGVTDAAHELTSSIHDVGSQLSNAIENTASYEQLTDTMDFDATGHIPVITIALSSFREVKLLAADKTDFITSAKNIALDATGAGVGGMAGAKAGATIGSFFCPGLGTAIGGLFGAVAGAIGGKSITNNIKMQPLKNAVSEYEVNYKNMKRETKANSISTASNIKEYAEKKKQEYENSEILNAIPVVCDDNIVDSIAVVIYQFILNEISEMELGIEKLKKSFWYSDTKHGEIVETYIQRISELQKQLPPLGLIQKSPQIAFETLLVLQMPCHKENVKIQEQIDACSKELKEVNDRNNSSVLVWSYMVNNVYQNTLNEIAEYANAQMVSLNNLFDRWKLKMNLLEKKINSEKGKLGLK